LFSGRWFSVSFSVCLMPSRQKQPVLRAKRDQLLVIVHAQLPDGGGFLAADGFDAAV